MVGCLQPLSRGSVHITAADPLAAPAIDSAYLTHPADVDVLVAGVTFCRRILATAPLRDAQRGAYDPPAELQTDEELAAFVRDKVESFNHAIGTAPMRPREGGGVVDSSLRVYGTRNLRVVRAFRFRSVLDTAEWRASSGRCVCPPLCEFDLLQLA